MNENNQQDWKLDADAVQGPIGRVVVGEVVRTVGAAGLEDVIGVSDVVYEQNQGFRCVENGRQVKGEGV